MAGWTPQLSNTLDKLILDPWYHYPLSEPICAHCFQSLISVPGIYRQSPTVICHPFLHKQAAAHRLLPSCESPTIPRR